MTDFMLTDRFEAALIYANRVHAHQNRKGSGIPYMSHILGVASLVLESGGNESEVIAGLLHDCVEDQGGENRLNDIRRSFGVDVAEIVDACSDSYGDPKPPWTERKQKYINRIRQAPEPVLRVSCADKLHNARSIIWDFDQIGEEIWGRFKGGKDGTLWYYTELSDLLQERFDSTITRELTRVVDTLKSL